MHEYGLAEGVLASVRQRADGRKVAGLRVRFGVRHAVDEESLAQAFSFVAEGTEAAGLFLADAGNRQRLQEALGFSGSPTQPVYFEALIRTQAVAGAPNATSIVATRVINL